MKRVYTHYEYLLHVRRIEILQETFIERLQRENKEVIRRGLARLISEHRQTKS